jgi:hypothetical protein
MSYREVWVMSLPLYLLRRSASQVSSALYSPEQRDLSVCIIDPRVDNQSSSQKDAVIHVSHENALKNGSVLTYTQLVDLVIKAEKVVIL